MTIFGSPESPAERLWVWRVLFPPIRLATLALIPVRLEGGERIPRDRRFLVIANHTSWKDPPAIALAFDIHIRYMAKREVFELPLWGGLLRASGMIPLRRGEGDRRAVATALRVLANGQPLGLFPEGTRSPDGRMRRVNRGVAFIAMRADVPILPVGIVGTQKARVAFPRRHDVVVRVGLPFHIGDLPEAKGGDHQAIADAMMRRVAALLPPHMRGAYADELAAAPD